MITFTIFYFVSFFKKGTFNFYDDDDDVKFKY